MANNIGQKV